MRIHVLGALVLSIVLIATPAGMATLINGTCDQGTAEVSASGSDGSGNSSTALAGWTYKLSQTPYANFYIGTNIRTWNQRPGYTTAGVGMAFHANPTGGKWVEAYQTVTDLVPGGTYDVSAWLLPVLVSGKPSGAKLTLGLKNPETGITTWGSAYGDDESEKGVWANSVVQSTASSVGEITIRINMVLGEGGWTAKSTPNAVFDDVTVTLVPEPSSLLVVLGGIAGLVVRRRR